MPTWAWELNWIMNWKCQLNIHPCSLFIWQDHGSSDGIQWSFWGIIYCSLVKPEAFRYCLGRILTVQILKPSFSRSWVGLQNLYFNTCPNNCHVDGPQTTLGKILNLVPSLASDIQDEETEVQMVTHPGLWSQTVAEPSLWFLSCLPHHFGGQQWGPEDQPTPLTIFQAFSGDPDHKTRIRCPFSKPGDLCEQQ